MPITFLFKATEGKPDFGSEANRERFYQVMNKYPGRDFRIQMIEEKRSLSQNRMYWLYLALIERETGNTAFDLNEYFKRTLLPPRFIKVFGKEVKIPGSSTELNKYEFSEYLDKISAVSGVPVPDTETFKKIHGMNDRAMTEEESTFLKELYDKTQENENLR